MGKFKIGETVRIVDRMTEQQIIRSFISQATAREIQSKKAIVINTNYNEDVPELSSYLLDFSDRNLWITEEAISKLCPNSIYGVI